MKKLVAIFVCVGIIACLLFYVNLWLDLQSDLTAWYVPQDENSSSDFSFVLENDQSSGKIASSNKGPSTSVKSTKKNPTGSVRSNGTVSTALDDFKNTLSGSKTSEYSPISEDAYRIRGLLDNRMRGIYDIVNRAVAQMHDGLISLGNCSDADISLAYFAVKTDHPEYFWMPFGYVKAQDENSRYIAFKYSVGDAKIDYLCTFEQRDEMLAQMQQSIKRAKAVLKPGMSQYERELALHDWLTANCTYDHTAIEQDRNMAFTSYGALVEGRAVCEGYARSMQLLLNNAGIECSLVIGKSDGEGHMWNIVKIDGRWYHMDSTWNDTSNNGYHSFFNIPDQSILTDRTIDHDFYSISDGSYSLGYNFGLPKCSAENANYCAMNGTMIKSDNEFAKIVSAGLVRAAENGKKSAEFAFSSSYDRVFDSVSSLHREVLDKECIETANRSLPENLKISRQKVVCNGVKKSKGFMISW